jgi:hypothetical protein
LTAAAIIGVAVSLVLLHRSNKNMRERDTQLQLLRQRTAQLEQDVARLSSTHPSGLRPEELEAYLALGYKEFDATQGSGHRRFRDQPRDPSQAGMLIEAYLERHRELSLAQRMILEFHAAQLFAMGRMNERAVSHLDKAWLPGRELGPNWNHRVEGMKSFLLLDREGLLAAQRKISGKDESGDLLIEFFGEPYADLASWGPLASKLSVPADASEAHRAAAEKVAQALNLSVASAPATSVGIPANCIWLEIRPLGASTPDVDGYIILHASKSTIITATSQRWLDAAVDRIIKSSRQHKGRREAPYGLMTSFEIAR